ncbi:MAG: inosine/xanthosine triphosphatase [Thermoprotei archaeon]|nr:MAG: inosine/xanthosine triphosphatase [Thermoprotei archaeon]
MSKDLRVAVGSVNPVKVLAVKQALELLNIKADILSCSVRTSVGPQPIGLKKTMQGAIERGCYAQNVCNSDWGIGIEAGLIDFPGTISGYMDFQICVIVDKEKRITIGVSMGFEFPTKVIGGVLKGVYREIEEGMEVLSGIRQIGEKMGAIGFLSKGTISRLDITRESVISALIPRVNRSIYGELKKVDEVMKLLY